MKTVEELARNIMQGIQYENGMCNRHEPESYPIYWLTVVTLALYEIIKENTGFEFTEEVIEMIISPEDGSEEWESFLELKGGKQLEDVLGHYFDRYPVYDKAFEICNKAKEWISFEDDLPKLERDIVVKDSQPYPYKEVWQNISKKDFNHLPKMFTHWKYID